MGMAAATLCQRWHTIAEMKRHREVHGRNRACLVMARTEVEQRGVRKGQHSGDGAGELHVGRQH